MKNLPKKIYLQLGEDVDEDTDFRELSDVCWCEDNTDESDIEYELANQSKWITINFNDPKTLPPMENEFIKMSKKIMTYDCFGNIHTNYYDHQEKRFVNLYATITHWQPLPEKQSNNNKI
jgi:hypothetical protein